MTLQCNLNSFNHLPIISSQIINTTSMAPIQHINPHLFILVMFTERETSAPNSDMPNLTSRNSPLGQQEASHVHNSGLYQAMLSDDESLEEYHISSEDYVVAEDDVNPPKRANLWCGGDGDDPLCLIIMR
ncbi:hypothetical protein O181_085083 [Austropuccinia psidii MF-1]|uniref:Uncharacterized protein n=1 Tax=Austropuccinia psidii MF-1 TaxID=1389203 RepID=A0A9Q3FWU2_9BASI|nr:hypothetical protein [Austropuccinia psidii MF-1]